MTKEKEQDLYYLRSIYKQLKDFDTIIPEEWRLSLSSEVFADNINWLNCYIDRLSRE